MTVDDIVKGRSSAESRWARFGPYYAMFPMDFACEVVSTYSQPGDFVLDPFAGRGSSLFAAAALKRSALGIEINPVGWLYSKVKLFPAAKGEVSQSMKLICSRSSSLALATRPAVACASAFRATPGSKFLFITATNLWVAAWIMGNTS